MWEIFTGKTPYYDQGNNNQNIIKYVYFENGRPDLKDIKEKIDNELYKMFERNWDKDVDKRMHFREIIPILERFYKVQLTN